MTQYSMSKIIWNASPSPKVRLIIWYFIQLFPDACTAQMVQLLQWIILSNSGSLWKCVFLVSLASTEDALLAGGLVCRAEADEEPCLLIFLLLLQVVVRLPLRDLSPHVWAWSWFQAQLLFYHLHKKHKNFSMFFPTQSLKDNFQRHKEIK